MLPSNVWVICYECFVPDAWKCFAAFTLNGETLMNRYGQDTAFTNLPSGIALVPVVSLTTDQKGTINLGRVGLCSFMTTRRYVNTLSQNGFNT